MKKQCRKCGNIKPDSEFYRHRQNKDGLFGKCKECTKSDVRANRLAKSDYYKQFDRSRTDDPRRKKARREYAEKRKKDPVLKDIDRIRKKEWQAKNAIKRGAHVIWGNSLRDGKVSLGAECERCCATDGLAAHHEDYTKPLEVITLCRDCHGLRHREINELIRNGEDWSGKGF